MANKRTVAVVVLFIMVVGAIAASVIATVVLRNKHSQQQAEQDEITASQKAVTNLCQNTYYPKACNKAMSSATNSTDPKELVKTAFQVAAKEVGNALKKTSIFRAAAKDSRTVQAYKICEELLDDSIFDLQKTIEEIDSFDISNLRKFADDIQTWLAGALTYQETCLDSFEDTKGDSGDKMGSLLKLSTELTTNALALANEFSSSFSPPATEKPKSSGKIGAPARRLALLQPTTPKNIKPNVVVAKDGTGKYKTINEALEEIPPNATTPFVIHVKEGVYEENVKFERSMRFVTLIGDGPEKTKITGNRSAGGGWKTIQTATVAVEGNQFIAKDIGIENTAEPRMHQAVALRVSSDESVFHNCKIEGHQDTLYVHNHRQFYRDCTISGTIDFIFGNARAILQNCTIVVRKPLPNQNCIVTAQSRSNENETSAIILQNCDIRADDNFPIGDKGIKLAYLGRPWKPLSRTIVMNSNIGQVIDPSGWTHWNATQTIDPCFFGEVGNRGPGADVALRVKSPGIKKMIIDEAMRFTPDVFMVGDLWIPKSGVPYSGGLMKI